jgi:hypothetical protein
VSSAAGKHPQGDSHNSTAIPDPTNITKDVANAKDKTSGDVPTTEHDKTKEPVAEKVWDKARPLMHGLADVSRVPRPQPPRKEEMLTKHQFVDTWERFGNALSPTAPFPRQRPRLILASCLLPLLLGSCITTPYMIIKGTGFGIGFGFFGDPVLQRGLAFINRHVEPRCLRLWRPMLTGI